MENQGSRISQLLKALNYKQLPFANHIGISQTFMNSIVKGKAGISRNVLEKIVAKFPSVNGNWLLTGSGTMFLSDQSTNTETDKMAPDTSPKRKRKIHIVAEENTIKEVLAANLKTAADHWEMFNAAFFALLDPDAGRQAVSNYMTGITVPHLDALVRFEYVTGIPLSILLTRKIHAEELPPAPIEPGDKVASLRADLLRIAENIKLTIQ